jgi:hypothetical protein
MFKLKINEFFWTSIVLIFSIFFLGLGIILKTIHIPVISSISNYAISWIIAVTISLFFIVLFYNQLDERIINGDDDNLYHLLHGRIAPVIMLQWFFTLLIVVLLTSLFVWLFNYFNLIEYTDTETINYIFRIVLFSSSSFLGITLLHLICLRMHDLNLPAYYFFLGIIPVGSFFVGVKIFKSGKFFIGILVFLNLIISIPFILFWPSDRGIVNYYGVNPKLIRLFNREKKLILRNGSLTQTEIDSKLSKLVEDYSKIEENALEEFVKDEIFRLCKKDLKKFAYNSVLNNNNDLVDSFELRLQNHYTEFVYYKISRLYGDSDWRKY